MIRVVPEGPPRNLSLLERHPKLAEIERQSQLPGHLFLTLDGNSREAEMLATEALSGNGASIGEFYRRIDAFHAIALPYVSKNPHVEKFYRDNLQEILEHVSDIPLPTLIGKLKEKRILPLIGHVKGAEITPNHLRELRELRTGIKIVTLWGLSDGNIDTRAPEEVVGLMWLMDYQIQSNLEELKRERVRFRHIGNKTLLAPFLLDTIAMAEEETQNNKEQTLCLAAGFGGRDTLRRLVDSVRRYPVSPDDEPTTDDFIARFLDGDGDIPPADLTIRTAGETRLSNPGILILGDGTEHYTIETPYPRTVIDNYVGGFYYFSTVERRYGGRPNST